MQLSIHNVKGFRVRAAGDGGNPTLAGHIALYIKSGDTEEVEISMFCADAVLAKKFKAAMDCLGAEAWKP